MLFFPFPAVFDRVSHRHSRSFTIEYPARVPTEVVPTGSRILPEGRDRLAARNGEAPRITRRSDPSASSTRPNRETLHPLSAERNVDPPNETAAPVTLPRARRGAPSERPFSPTFLRREGRGATPSRKKMVASSSSRNTPSRPLPPRRPRRCRGRVPRPRRAGAGRSRRRRCP